MERRLTSFGWRTLPLRGSVLALLAVAAGCRTNSCEYVEAELRHTNAKLAETQKTVAERDAEIAALKATVSATTGQPLATAGADEHAYRRSSLSKIEFTMTTGGKDADGDGKDDGVLLGLACRDYDGDAFKCPGAVAVGLFEVLPNGMKRQLGAWVYDSDAVRQAWRSTLLGAAYAFEIPWPMPPAETKLVATAAFQTMDGRRFEAEKPFSVALQVKGAAKQPGKALAMAPTPLPPGAQLQMPAAPAEAKPSVSQSAAKLPPPKLPPVAMPNLDRKLGALNQALDQALPGRADPLPPLTKARPNAAADDETIDLGTLPEPAKPHAPTPVAKAPAAAKPDDEFIDLDAPVAPTAGVAKPPAPALPDPAAPKQLAPKILEGSVPLPSAALDRGRKGSIALKPWDMAPPSRDTLVRPAVDR